MKLPFHLAAAGYVPDPANPLRFLSTRGHPYYPVSFTTSTDKNLGDCIEAIATAAHEAGVAAQKDFDDRVANQPIRPDKSGNVYWQEGGIR